MPIESRIVEFAGFRLDVAERVLLSPDGDPVPLTPKLFDTLVFMVERPGRLIEKRALMESVWARVIVEENTLSRTISTLRQLLGESAGDNRFIATVPGVGYRFVPAVTSADSYRPASAALAPSIAVLPFEDLSPDHDHQYFSDGMAEELIMRLSAISGLHVIAKTSSSRLAGAAAREVGRQLAVSHVMSGAVRKSGTRLRINVQLADAASEQLVWSGQYDRLLDDILAVQEDISRAVAQALRATLGLGGRTTIGNSSRHAEAYDLYLRAKALASRNPSQSLAAAVELTRRAVALDPEFALAWSQIATVSRNLMFAGPGRTAEIRTDIEVAANRALQLEPRWWPAHLAQSVLHHIHGNWSEMERSLARAAEYAPGFPWELNVSWCVFHNQVGDTTAAVEYLREAVRQDPLSLVTSSVYQLLLHHAGLEDIAEAEYQRSLDLPGDRDMVEHVALHRAWARGGSFIAQYRRYVDHQSLSIPVLIALVDHHEDAGYMVRELRKAAAAPTSQDPVRQMILAWWLTKYGDVDAALAIMTRVYVDQAQPMLDWIWFPVFAPVRQRPEFLTILERTGLAAYWNSRQNWGDYCEPGADGAIRCKR